MGSFWYEWLTAYFLALGMVLGGALAGGLLALLAGTYPLTTLLALSDRLRIWAVAAALGGTITAFQNLEAGLLGGEMRLLGRQLLLLVAAFGGALTAHSLLTWIARRP